jgi:hypothetical protein
MARKKAAPEPVPAKIETKYTDTVTLKRGSEPLRISDLAALVDTARNEIFLNEELAEVSLTGGGVSYDPVTAVVTTQPVEITVTHVTKNEETL